MSRLWLAGLAAAAGFVPIPAVVAAGKPLAIALSPSSQTVIEGQTATITLSKSGGGKPMTVRVTTSDGSVSGSVYPGTSFAIPTIDDGLVNGTRTLTVTAVASTGATARATVTILDNDVASPSPPAPPATQTCPDGSVIPATSPCPTLPPPPPPSGACAALTADMVTPVAPAATICTATKTCPDARGIPADYAPGVVEGRQYFVGRGTWWIPAPVVVAAPVDGRVAYGNFVSPDCFG